MQTQMNLFALSSIKASDEPNLVAQRPGQRFKASAQAKAEDFLQVMGTLLSLPPEQLLQSLTGLKGDTLKEEGAAFATVFDLAGKDPETAQLLQAFLQQHGVDKEALVKGKGTQQANALLYQLQSLLAANAAMQTVDSQGQPGADLAAVDSNDEEMANWQSKWQQFWHQVRLNLQSEQAGGGESSAEAGDKSAALEAAMLKNPHRHATNTFASSAMTQQDAEDAPHSEPDTKKFMKLAGINRPRDGVGLERAVASRNSQPAANALAQNSTFQGLAESSSTPSAEQLEPSLPQVADQGSKDKSSGQEGQATIARVADLNVQDLLKAVDPNTSQQNPLSALESKSAQDVEIVSAKKELLPAEKQMQNDIIRQIVQRMSMHSQGDQSKMVIRLKPEFLGNVHMQVLTENHQVSVHMMADSAAVKEIIEQNLQHLRLELQHHGLEIHKFDVFVGNTNQERESRQDRAAFSHSSRQRQQRSSKNSSVASSAVETGAVKTRSSPKQTNLNEVDYFV